MGGGPLPARPGEGRRGDAGLRRAAGRAPRWPGGDAGGRRPAGACHGECRQGPSRQDLGGDAGERRCLPVRAGDGGARRPRGLRPRCGWQSRADAAAAGGWPGVGGGPKPVQGGTQSQLRHAPEPGRGGDPRVRRRPRRSATADGNQQRGSHVPRRGRPRRQRRRRGHRQPDRQRAGDPKGHRGGCRIRWSRPGRRSQPSDPGSRAGTCLRPGGLPGGSCRPCPRISRRLARRGLGGGATGLRMWPLWPASRLPSGGRRRAPGTAAGGAGIACLLPRRPQGHPDPVVHDDRRRHPRGDRGVACRRRTAGSGYRRRRRQGGARRFPWWVGTGRAHPWRADRAVEGPGAAPPGAGCRRGHRPGDEAPCSPAGLPAAGCRQGRPGRGGTVSLVPGTSIATWLPPALRDVPGSGEASLSSARLLDALLAAVDTQYRLLAADIDQVWEDLFVESCAPWVVPYLAVLVGLPSDAERAEVAYAIALRRRKGTPGALRDFAEVLTAFSARVVEGWQVTLWSQRLGYPPPTRAAALSLADVAASRVGTPFDRARRSFTPGGNFDPAAATAVVWPWRVFTYRGTQAVPVSLPSAPSTHRYALHPLGVPAPLYIRPRPLSLSAEDLAASGGPAPAIEETGAPVRVTRRLIEALAGPGDLSERSEEHTS